MHFTNVFQTALAKMDGQSCALCERLLGADAGLPVYASAEARDAHALRHAASFKGPGLLTACFPAPSPIKTETKPLDLTHYKSPKTEPVPAHSESEDPDSRLKAALRGVWDDVQKGRRSGICEIRHCAYRLPTHARRAPDFMGPRGKLVDHISTHAKLPLFTCRLCGARLTSQIGNHLHIKHSGESQRKGQSYDDHTSQYADQLVAALHSSFPLLGQPASVSVKREPDEAVSPKLEPYKVRKARSKPLRCLAIVSLVYAAEKRLGLTRSCDLCQRPIAGDYFVHANRHAQLPCYRCPFCGLRSTYLFNQHFDRVHPEIKAAQPAAAKFEDLRGELEAELEEALFAAFGSVLRDAAKVLPSARPPAAWLRCLQRAARGAEPLACAEPGCDFTWARGEGTLVLETHALAHFDEPVYACLLCPFQGTLDALCAWLSLNWV